MASFVASALALPLLVRLAPSVPTEQAPSRTAVEPPPLTAAEPALPARPTEPTEPTEPAEPTEPTGLAEFTTLTSQAAAPTLRWDRRPTKYLDGKLELGPLSPSGYGVAPLDGMGLRLDQRETGIALSWHPRPFFSLFVALRVTSSIVEDATHGLKTAAGVGPMMGMRFVLPSLVSVVRWWRKRY